MKVAATAGLVLLVWVVISAGTGSTIAAQPVDIPDALKPWREWVLHDTPDRTCPTRFDNGAIRRCWWPSRLSLAAGDQGGLFEMQVSVYAPTWVPLPGDEAHWPESVTGNNQVQPVVGHGGRPHVWLTPGDYDLKGAMVWNALPETLQVPPAIGIFSLTIDGRNIDAPQRDLDGRIRLVGTAGTTRREDTMTVTVFRLIEDDIPMRVTTRALLQVSGRPREIRLPDLLPEAGTVMAIDSPLPARLATTGDLLVQARPGRWDVRVTVRLEGAIESLTTGKGRFGDEIWSFKAFNHLRMVNLTGAPSLEPTRTQMPDAWKAYPAYLLKPGDQLTIEKIRRGDPDPAPNQLNLTRIWWLDFDGSGFTIHDRIHGTLSRTWHLAMGSPMQLGRVSIDGQDQLITLQKASSAPGVQLRRGKLSLQADSRLARTSARLPAVGWDHDFQQVSGELHLPPGWTLFSATGVDVPPGAWLQRWTLLDFFLVLIIAISTLKLRNRLAGLLILATLVLIFHEAGAPRFVWLHLLAVFALLKFLPGGWIRNVVKLWGAAAIIVLVATALPFMVQQVRSAIYPQLTTDGTGRQLQKVTTDYSVVEEAQMEAPPAAPSVKGGRSLKAAVSTMAQPPSPARETRWAADPDALIQTGPGLPTWRWKSTRLRWNGPVARNQQINLWLISPFLNLVLGLLRVGLLLASIMVFLDWRNWRRHLPPSVSGAVPLLLAMGVLMMPTLNAHAEPGGQEFPPQPLLEDLHRRLLEPPACLPHCADVSRLELAATPDQLRLIMQMHALADTAVPLPATLESWRPNRILLDNQPVKHLSRDERGGLWMVLPKGVHQVKMIGSLGGSDTIRIAFPIKPHVGTYAGVGWQARGFGPDGSMDAVIALTRVAGDKVAAPALPKADIPDYFQVSRTLHLGIQWQVTTQIQRLTAPGKPAVLSIPLLPDASVTSPGIQVADGIAQVSLGPNETQSQFRSSLPIVKTLTLTAPLDVPWTETWTLDAAPLWQCRLSGLAVVHHQDAGRSWQPQWRPWPGEQVTIDITRPESVAGRTFTLDSARVTLTPGRRFSRAALSMIARSSKGGQHQLELPQEVNLQSVIRNGELLPIRQDGQLVTIPLMPGSQTIDLEWLQLSDAMIQVRSPRIDLGDTAVNAAVTIQMPDNRWILLTGGPRLGPAVLFWSYLIVVVLAAAGLGRTKIAPLGTLEWVLLGLGLTQVPAPVAIVVVGWLLALGYRCQRSPRQAWAFNTVQLLLVILTVAALTGLYTAIERGLLGIPDMQIAGNGSSRFQLNWTQDRVEAVMPMPWVLSLPKWVYHLLMLAWSLWLAFSLLNWLRWGWGCFSSQHLWRPIRWRWKTKTSQESAGQPEPAAADAPPLEEQS